MKIEVKGRNLPVSDDLKERITRRFRVIEKQVSELAQLEVEIYEQHNPSISESHVVEATLYLKGVTSGASGASPAWPGPPRKWRRLPAWRCRASAEQRLQLPDRGVVPQDHPFLLALR
jgi:hypothetical protein